MSGLLYAILAVAVVSLLSLVGIFAISLKETTLDRILFVLLSFSAGSILGAVYLNLLPEAIEFLGEEVLTSTAGSKARGYREYTIIPSLMTGETS